MAERDFVVGQNIVADNTPSIIETTLATNSATTIGSFNKNESRAAEFVVTVDQANGHTLNRVTVMHNGAESDHIEYGKIEFGRNQIAPAELTSSPTWTTSVGGYALDGSGKIVYANNVFVNTAFLDSHVKVSTDAVTWTSSPTSEYPMSIAYGDGTWVLIHSFPSSGLSTSTDLVSWTTRTSNFTGLIYTVKYGNGVFAAVGASNQMRTSTDGITWVTRNPGLTGEDIFNVWYGNGIWAVAATAGQISRSTDTVTWTTSTLPDAMSYSAIAYSGGEWGVVNRGGLFYRSTDAISWTSVIPGPENLTGYFNLTYAQNQWVASGYEGGTETHFLRSTDGTTWSLVATPFGLNFGGPTGGIAKEIIYGNNTWVGLGSTGSYVLATIEPELISGEIPIAFSTEVSGSDVNLKATVTDAADFNADVRVTKTVLEA